ncbi:hypothetical protein [Modestobacter roseus]|uniref:Uncharacterized protein n=1 Tax=Modestobacter roseus TaxID=1181884 RepID=A0A562IRT2_9ACTN|nr:hypothetical protein [Modestobacter roseus]MQA33176.1 hypothetical protein [Modestobacter roseus]TWH73274.1 hypothetical protein JD78_01797 [Modestobacter roseus]
MPLILHLGGPRDGQVDDLPADALASSLLVYDGPRWLGVYERVEPRRVVETPRGPAEVWAVHE